MPNFQGLISKIRRRGAEMRIAFILIFFVWCRSTVIWAIDDSKAQQYIDEYMSICVFEMHQHGIPASIKMAQALLESGAGQSELATKANNHFGMKCGGDWQGKTYKKWDDEVVKSCFRVYANADSSFKAHSQFLLNPKKAYRYGFLFKLDQYDYKAWAIGLQTAGYATSKTYAKNLIALIERYRLYKLDHLAVETMDLIPGFMSTIFPHESVVLVNEKGVVFTYKKVNPYGTSYDSVVVEMTLDEFSHNSLTAVFVQPNDDLDKIALRYRVKKRQLIRWNELNNNDLQSGQILYLSPKRPLRQFCKKMAVSVHIVKPNESWYQISQWYGLRIRQIKGNRKSLKTNVPRAGSAIVLCPCNMNHDE